MPVLNGQPVSAEITNPAFLDAQEDDFAVGRIGLKNTLGESGAFIDNLQRAINALFATTGSSETVEGTVYSAPANTITDGDSHQTALTKLANKFHATTGHTHDGTSGNGPLVAASDLSDVPLRGYFIQGTDLLATTGSSLDVSSYLSLKTASSDTLTEGVVVNTPRNTVIIRRAGGQDNGDTFIDSSGNAVFGRLTYALGVWTLSFYTDVAGSDIAYSFSSSSNVRWFYQELFNPLLNPPTYNELAVVPSDNAAVDVVLATTSVQGKVLLSSSDPSNVSDTADMGTGNGTVANADHVHEGVHSVGINGELTRLLGDVDFVPGDNITMEFDGSLLKVNAVLAGTGSLVNAFQETPVGTIDGTNTDFDLSRIPQTVDSLMVFIDDTIAPISTWTLSGTTITFLAGSIPQPGQSVYAFYSGDSVKTLQEVPTGMVDGSNDTFDLSSAPVNANALLLYLDSVVVEKTDFTLSGTTIVLDTPPELGQTLYAFYLTAGNPGVFFGGASSETEYHTVSAPEATAKQFSMLHSPAAASKVMVDVVGSTSQIYGVDFTISGNTFDWSGLGLDGDLSAGDVVRLYYFY